MKFRYVFAVSELSLYTKNCDHKLDTFFIGTYQNLEYFDLIYIPLFIGLYDNVTTKTVQLRVFEMFLKNFFKS